MQKITLIFILVSSYINIQAMQTEQDDIVNEEFSMQPLDTAEGELILEAISENDEDTYAPEDCQTINSLIHQVVTEFFQTKKYKQSDEIFIMLVAEPIKNLRPHVIGS